MNDDEAAIITLRLKVYVYNQVQKRQLVTKL